MGTARNATTMLSQKKAFTLASAFGCGRRFASIVRTATTMAPATGTAGSHCETTTHICWFACGVDATPCARIAERRRSIVQIHAAAAPIKTTGTQPNLRDAVQAVHISPSHHRSEWTHQRTGKGSHGSVYQPAEGLTPIRLSALSRLGSGFRPSQRCRLELRDSYESFDPLGRR